MSADCVYSDEESGLFRNFKPKKQYKDYNKTNALNGKVSWIEIKGI